MSYNVYVKTDASGYIVAINSDAFMTDTTGWVLIDTGDDIEYMHAQNYYLDEPLTTDIGVHNYKLVDGAVVHCTEAELAEEEEAIKHMSDITSFETEYGSAAEPVLVDLPDTQYYAVRTLGSSVGTIFAELSGDAYSADDPHFSLAVSGSECSTYLRPVPTSKKLAFIEGRGIVYCSNSREALKEALMLRFGCQGNRRAST